MSWSGAGIPVIGTQILSGAQVVVLKIGRYLVEHPVVGLEGGIVENVGSPQDRIEIHGIAYDNSASDAFLATLSGYISNNPQNISIPSSNSGYYFVLSGSKVTFETLKYIYDAGHGYPFYHYVIAGVMSGVFIQSGWLTYVQPNQVNMQIYVAYLQPEVVNMQVYGTYVQPNRANYQLYGGYVLISGVSGY